MTEDRMFSEITKYKNSVQCYSIKIAIDFVQPFPCNPWKIHGKNKESNDI